MNYKKIAAAQRKAGAEINRKLEEAIQKNVKATLAVEGLHPSETAKEITRRYLEGTYTSEKAVMEIKKMYGFGGACND
jgi:2-iminoacetate synthase ThiH